LPAEEVKFTGFCNALAVRVALWGFAEDLAKDEQQRPLKFDPRLDVFSRSARVWTTL
jgi:hypothetical protein